MPLVPVFPPPSVARARSSYVPSAREPVDQIAEKPSPDAASVPIWSHGVVPDSRYSNATLAVSTAAVAVRVGEPVTAAPGSARVTVGASLSTVKVTTADSAWLPAPSVATTLISTGPSATELLSQVVETSPEAALATVVKPAAPAGLSWTAVDEIPEVASPAEPPSATDPETKLPPAGVETVAVGEPLSTVFGRPGSSWIVSLPSWSSTRARRS